jgi:hypothetical protein
MNSRAAFVVLLAIASLFCTHGAVVERPASRRTWFPARPVALRATLDSAMLGGYDVTKEPSIKSFLLKWKPVADKIQKSTVDALIAVPDGDWNKDDTGIYKAFDGKEADVNTFNDKIIKNLDDIIKKAKELPPVSG